MIKLGLEIPTCDAGGVVDCGVIIFSKKHDKPRYQPRQEHCAVVFVHVNLPHWLRLQWPLPIALPRQTLLPLFATADAASSPALRAPVQAWKIHVCGRRVLSAIRPFPVCVFDF